MLDRRRPVSRPRALFLAAPPQVYEVQVYDRADLPKSSTLGIFEVALASTPFPASDKARCGGCRL